jgi:hypothetical protein
MGAFGERCRRCGHVLTARFPGIGVPKNTPAETVDELNTGFNAALVLSIRS